MFFFQDDTKGNMTRNGTEGDVTRLREVFEKKLGFNFTHYNDQTKAELKKKLEKGNVAQLSALHFFIMYPNIHTSILQI